MNWRLKICIVVFFILFFISLSCFFVGLNFCLFKTCYFIDWEVLNLNTISITMTMLFDWMSLIFLSYVFFISSMVVLYSNDYMEGDPYLVRFIILVISFIFSMMLLIISPNMVSILLGWDGLGLTSYLLVVYYQNFKSYSAGMLTVLSNRLGDVAFLISISWMLNFGSWNFIFYVDMFSFLLEASVLSFLVIFAAMTKSAQIPFSSWLPAAMAAPTPVSALVHSSTLVTAGVYLMIRFNCLIVSTGYCKYLLFIGGMTMFMSGLGANFEFDLKKIIALSTLSQLGLMMSTLSMGFCNFAFFHLLTHALFKALLFMCAGVMIHNLCDNQDIRCMGGLLYYLPFTSVCFCVSNLALCGMPFLAGFYSKDLILEMSLFGLLNLFSFFFIFVSSGFTVCYTVRLIYYIMLGGVHLSKCVNINEGLYMLKSMLSMVFMVVISGSFLSWFIFPYPFMINLPLFLKVLVLLLSLAGIILVYLLFYSSYNCSLFSLYFYTSTLFLGMMWFMPYVSTQSISLPFLSLGKFLLKSFDYGWCELFGGQGLFNLLRCVSGFIQFLQLNLIKTYLMWFIIFV
uniref:NADH-ubiquinone oxidoreductase chain 5 n=1 Tax=Megaloprepus caerulatus TaxID=263994 RepID=A0A342ZZN4_9ODON|nr:NADH dehydrogenase subunit 5 [Megaloprepus caerulatus]AOW43835.1 NADH dehydrogenase subunit 5 [Megaloprepus caerulatus]